MDNSKDILLELVETAPLLATKKTIMPYEVSNNYFAEFPQLMVDKMLINEQTGITIQQPYQVPKVYFDKIAEEIVELVRKQAYIEDELEEVAPQLIQIPKTNPYTVSDHYFNTLTIEPPKAAIRIFPTFVRYSAAAVVATLLLAGSWLWYQQINSTSQGFAQVDMTSDINQHTDEELIHYLNFEANELTSESVNIEADNTMSMQQHIDQYTDDELANFYINESKLYVNLEDS